MEFLLLNILNIILYSQKLVLLEKTRMCRIKIKKLKTVICYIAMIMGGE